MASYDAVHLYRDPGTPGRLDFDRELYRRIASETDRGPMTAPEPYFPFSYLEANAAARPGAPAVWQYGRELSSDLATRLETLEIERPLVPGLSAGGTIAMAAALDGPELVGGLVLAATSSRVGRAAARWCRERAELAERNDPGLSARLERDTEDVYRESPETAAGWRLRRDSTRDPRGYGNGCRAMAGLNEGPVDPELPRIRARTPIVPSDLDQRCPPRAAEIIAAGIEGSHLVVLPGGGHPIPVELPQELARLIQNENPDG